MPTSNDILSKHQISPPSVPKGYVYVYGKKIDVSTAVNSDGSACYKTKTDIIIDGRLYAIVYESASHGATQGKAGESIAAKFSALPLTPRTVELFWGAIKKTYFNVPGMIPPMTRRSSSVLVRFARVIQKDGGDFFNDLELVCSRWEEFTAWAYKNVGGFKYPKIPTAGFIVLRREEWSHFVSQSREGTQSAD